MQPPSPRNPPRAPHAHRAAQCAEVAHRWQPCPPLTCCQGPRPHPDAGPPPHVLQMPLVCFTCDCIATSSAATIAAAMHLCHTRLHGAACIAMLTAVADATSTLAAAIAMHVTMTASTTVATTMVVGTPLAAATAVVLADTTVALAATGIGPNHGDCHHNINNLRFRRRHYNNTCSSCHGHGHHPCRH